ncbi:hypothetical protein [Noviherbaspirillum sp. ST9]|uniref:hypothetical protein n=1 Tax=Noviherbaspirillum sp. ST9 TaxID=3401606 RepID=UPI003B585DD5
MTTLSIKDLSITEELDAKGMAAVRGGCSYCPPKVDMPKLYGKPTNLSFDASQMIGQSQNVENNNGNNVAFASGITSTVSPTQTGNNNINFGYY